MKDGYYVVSSSGLGQDYTVTDCIKFKDGYLFSEFLEDIGKRYVSATVKVNINARESEIIIREGKVGKNATYELYKNRLLNENVCQINGSFYSYFIHINFK